MSGMFWHVFTYTIIGIFLIIIIYRTASIVRMPVHLRWELAPIPHEKGKGHYGGSYLEEYEWWRKPQKKSFIAPLVYMAKEILLLRGVWENNRSLWPFSFALHAGIYLVTGMLILSLLNAVFIITGVQSSVLNIFQGIASVLALTGYLLGGLGAIGLILKRATDNGLRPFNTVSTYFRLVFLGAVFISGAYTWFYQSDFASDISLFIKSLITLNAGITATTALSVHLIISLLFLLYLPLTDMIHFVAKYFTYHAVRWNDEVKNEKMERKLLSLLAQPVGWSAAHVNADNRKNWTDVSTEEKSGKKKP